MGYGMVVSPPSRPQEAALARGSCGVTCAGVKGGTPEVDAIEDSRRRGTGVVESDATEAYIVLWCSAGGRRVAAAGAGRRAQVAIRWAQPAGTARSLDMWTNTWTVHSTGGTRSYGATTL